MSVAGLVVAGGAGERMSRSGSTVPKPLVKIRGVTLLERNVFTLLRAGITDIHVAVPRVDYEKLANKRQVEDSKTIRARAQAASERQLERFKWTKMTCNAEIGPTEVRQYCQTDASGEKLLKAAVQQLHLSDREYIAS